MKLFLARDEYLPYDDQLGFVIDHVDEYGVEMSATDPWVDQYLTSFRIEYQDVAGGETTLITLYEKIYALQGIGREEVGTQGAAYLLFQMSTIPLEFQELKLQVTEGSRVSYSERLAFQVNEVFSDGISLFAIDLLPDQPVSYFKLTDEDVKDRCGTIVTHVGEQFVLQGLGEEDGEYKVRISRVSFPPLPTEKQCNCNTR